MDSHNIQPVEEIFPEMSFPYHRLKILVRRRYYPGIYRHRIRTTKPCYLLFLQDTENLDLKGEWHITDLIKEQSTSGCELKETCLTLQCSCECSLLITEKLRFKKILRNTSDVYRDERPFLHRRETMNLPRNDFLSCTGLSCYENSGMSRGNLLDDTLYIHHLRAFAYKTAVFTGALCNRFQGCRLDKVLELYHDLLGIERLHDIIISAILQRFDGIGYLTMGAYHYRGHPEAFLPQPFKKLKAIHPWHPQVDKHRVIYIGSKHPLCRQTILRRVGIETFKRKKALHQISDILFIIAYKNLHSSFSFQNAEVLLPLSSRHPVSDTVSEFRQRQRQNVKISTGRCLNHVSW